MAADFTIKAFDRLPAIRATLNADLTTAVSVDFIMRPIAGGTPKVNAAAVVISSGATSVVEYQWIAADTNLAGSYQAEWEVHWPSSKTQTFPTLTYHTIDVLADLDGAA